MIRYKIDIFSALKENGYNQTVIQSQKLIGSETARRIKAGKSITLDTLNKICMMTGLQPGEIIEYVDCPGELQSFLEGKSGNLS